MTRINPISWAGKLLRLLHIKGKTTTDCQADLPRDIILDILSRLPAELIFRFQCVSRPLQVLTTTPFFIHMQRQRSTSVIVVQLPSSEESPVCEFAKLCYMDKKFERIEEKFFESLSSPIGSSYYSTTYTRFLLGSYDGFLMFANFDGLPQTFYIWNPITEEQLAIEDTNTHVCGLYFNPVIKDNELLYYTTTNGSPDFGQYYNFGAYNLRTKLKRDVGRFRYPPSRHRLPVIINGTLYWMIDRSHVLFSVNTVSRPPFEDSIMSFNIETEQFSTLEPGGPKYSVTELGGGTSRGMLRICRLHLSEMYGELCLCDFVNLTNNQLLLSIYNHATQYWSTRAIVVLPEYHYPDFDHPNIFTAEVVQIKDNELLVRQGSRLVFYNMLTHACKISEIMGFKDKGIRATVHAHRIASFHL
ncbi:hypothetical protein MKX03_014906 [Papaver bracteatum]|nr:hypothetical protein MKX03_014906 [Papaver bracteatum]